jgi:hypothetical protein
MSKGVNKMRRIVTAIAWGSLFLTSAYADAWDKKTILTVNEPILVPGATLQPGKYVLKLIDSQSARHIVRISNEREDQVITTILAIPNYQLKVRGSSEFMFWETPAGNPPALRAWFYPGDNFGQEFAYPRGLAAKIATTVSEPVPAYEPVAEPELATVPVTTVKKPAEPVEVAQAPAKPPQPEPEPTPAPAPAPAPQEMPRTGSFGPTILLAGLAALGTGIGLRAAIRRR